MVSLWTSFRHARGTLQKLRLGEIMFFFTCEELAPFLYMYANSEAQPVSVRPSHRSQIGFARVIREQQVLPEVRNRPLLLRELISSSTFGKLLRIQHDTFPFDPFNIRYAYKTKLKFEKFGIGGWCVASCTSIQCSKFTVQA